MSNSHEEREKRDNLRESRGEEERGEFYRERENKRERARHR